MIQILNIVIPSFSDLALTLTSISILTNEAIVADACRGQYSLLQASDSVMDHWTSYKSDSRDVRQTRTASPPLNSQLSQPNKSISPPTRPARYKKSPYYLTTLKVPPNTPAVQASSVCEPLLSSADSAASSTISEADTSSAEHLPTAVSDLDLDLSQDNISSAGGPSFQASSASLSVSSQSAISLLPSESRHSGPIGLGLGLSGLRRKDTDTPFDGLGIVDIHGWIRQSQAGDGPHLQSPDVDLASYPLTPCNSENKISTTVIQETFLTFLDDPLHEHTSVSHCASDSWDGLEEVAALGEGASVDFNENQPVFRQSIHRSGRGRGADSLQKPRKPFWSSTISSEMKRTKAIRRRERASTCPSNMDPLAPGWRI